MTNGEVVNMKLYVCKCLEIVKDTVTGLLTTLARIISSYLVRLDFFVDGSTQM